MRFNRKTLSSLRLPDGKPYVIFWDDDLPGFGIRINPTNRVWVVQYRAGGKSRRETIGRTDTISLELARDAAKQTLAKVQLGADPHSEKAEANARRAVTVGKIASQYLAKARERLKPRSYVEVERHLNKDWDNLKDTPLENVNRRIVAARLDEIARTNGPIAANRARSSLSALYAYSLGMGLADHNPVAGTLKLGTEIKRDHVIADTELSALWHACGGNDYGRILQVLLLTAQRRDEVGSMSWSELDLDNASWTIQASRSKNRRAHEVPLPPLAVEILRKVPRTLARDLVFGSGRGGFSGWSKAKAEIDTEINSRMPTFRAWRIHDLRRTAATGMATLGIQPHVVEAVLNHISGSRAGVAGIYNRATYSNEKREALTLWSEHVHKLVSKQAA